MGEVKDPKLNPVIAEAINGNPDEKNCVSWVKA